jgi:hypothetical protein
VPVGRAAKAVHHYSLSLLERQKNKEEKLGAPDSVGLVAAPSINQRAQATA